MSYQLINNPYLDRPAKPNIIYKKANRLPRAKQAIPELIEWPKCPQAYMNVNNFKDMPLSNPDYECDKPDCLYCYCMREGVK